MFLNPEILCRRKNEKRHTTFLFFEIWDSQLLFSLAWISWLIITFLDLMGKLCFLGDKTVLRIECRNKRNTIWSILNFKNIVYKLKLYGLPITSKKLRKPGFAVQTFGCILFLYLAKISVLILKRLWSTYRAQMNSVYARSSEH